MAKDALTVLVIELAEIDRDLDVLLERQARLQAEIVRLDEAIVAMQSKRTIKLISLKDEAKK